MCFQANSSYFIAVLMGFILLSCASMGSLSGGEKDLDPPKIIWENSTPNASINFSARQITLYFDEWIQLSNPATEIFISPPIDPIPEFKLKGKSLQIHFDPETQLEKNTTYAIFFGESVKDLTEGNHLPNFQYVFSTGPEIDSLSIEGRVIDAYSGEAIQNAFVHLYPKGEDSIVAKQRPSYLTRVDDKGRFKIAYIRKDSFILFAIHEQLKNYLYDAHEEMIGFLDTTIEVGIENPYYAIRMSTPEAPFKLEEVRKFKNGFVLAPNHEPDSIAYSWSENPKWSAFENRKDSIHFWFHFNDTLLHSFYFHYPGGVDTIKLKDRKPDSTGTLEITSGNNFAAFGSIQFQSDEPIAGFDTSRMVLRDTTGDQIRNYTLEKIEKKPTQFFLHLDTSLRSPLQILFDPGSIQFIDGRTIDTTRFTVQPYDLDKLGSLTLSLEESHDEDLLIYLYKKDQRLKDFRLMSGDPNKIFQFDFLRPGTDYLLHFVEDKNGNGRWDPANYWLKSQSEKVYLFEIDEIRANWEQDLQISLKGKL